MAKIITKDNLLNLKQRLVEDVDRYFEKNLRRDFTIKTEQGQEVPVQFRLGVDVDNLQKIFNSMSMIDSIDFRGADNKFYTLTKKDLELLQKESFLIFQDCFKLKSLLKDYIYSEANIEKLKGLNIKEEFING